MATSIFDLLGIETKSQKQAREFKAADQALARQKFEASQEASKREQSQSEFDRRMKLLDNANISDQAKQVIGQRLSQSPQLAGFTKQVQQGNRAQAEGLIEPAKASLFDSLRSGNLPLQDVPQAVQGAGRTLQGLVDQPVNLFDFANRKPTITGEFREGTTTSTDPTTGKVTVLQQPVTPPSAREKAFGLLSQEEQAEAVKKQGTSTTNINISQGKPETAAQRQKQDDLISFRRDLKGVIEDIDKPEFQEVVGVAKGRAAGVAEAFGITEKTPILGKAAKFVEDTFGIKATQPTVQQVRFRQVVKDMADRVLRLRSGAQINNQEFVRLMAILPHPNLPIDTFKGRAQGTLQSIDETIAQRQASQVRSGIIPQIDEQIDQSAVTLMGKMREFSQDKYTEVQDALKRGVSPTDILAGIESKSKLSEIKGNPSSVRQVVDNVKQANARGKATASNAPSERTQPQTLTDKIALQETSKAVGKENGIRVEELLVSHPQSISAMQGLIREEKMNLSEVGRFLKIIKDKGLTDEQVLQRLEDMRGGQ